MSNVHDTIMAAMDNWAEKVSEYTDLENKRIHEKIAAIGRIMEKPNELTGKPHSFSSAEAVVNTDEAYQEYLGRCRQAQVEQMRAQGNYEATKLAAIVETSVTNV